MTLTVRRIPRDSRLACKAFGPILQIAEASWGSKFDISLNDGAGTRAAFIWEVRMTQERDNVALLKDAYAQWAGQKGADCECWMNILAEDVSLSSLADGSPEMSFSAPRSSKAQILDYLQELRRDWEMIAFDMGDFIAQGDRVVVIGRVAWRNKATGKIADTSKVDIWRFQDGKAVEMAEFYDTARAFAAATP